MPHIGQPPIFGFLFYFIFVSSSFDSFQPLDIDFVVVVYLFLLFCIKHHFLTYMMVRGVEV